MILRTDISSSKTKTKGLDFYLWLIKIFLLPFHKEKIMLPLCCPNTFVTKQDGYNITCPLNDTLDEPRVCESSAWTVKELESIPKNMEGRNYCFGPSLWPAGKEYGNTGCGVFK